MNVSRREFFTGLGLGAVSLALPGSCDLKCAPRKHINARIALQLYSIGAYIAGQKDKDGKVIVPGGEDQHEARGDRRRPGDRIEVRDAPAEEGRLRHDRRARRQAGKFYDFKLALQGVSSK